MSAVHTIHLHGRLKRRFGAEFALAVRTPVEAVRALAMQLPGFAEAMSKGAFRLVRGKSHKKGTDFSTEEALFLPIGRESRDFHIVPVVAGAKGGGGKALMGVAIIAAATIGAFFSGGASLASLAAIGNSISAGFAGTGVGGALLATALKATLSFGMIMTMTGISQMLAPSVKAPKTMERPDQRPSFFLGGQVNQAVQGGAIPLAYGRCRVGSTVISAGLSAERI